MHTKRTQSVFSSLSFNSFLLVFFCFSLCFFLRFRPGSGSGGGCCVTIERQKLLCVQTHRETHKCGEDTKACKAIRSKMKSAKDEASVCLQRNITLMQLYNLLYFIHKRLFVCVRLASLKSDRRANERTTGVAAKKGKKNEKINETIVNVWQTNNNWCRTDRIRCVRCGAQVESIFDPTLA